MLFAHHLNMFRPLSSEMGGLMFFGLFSQISAAILDEASGKLTGKGTNQETPKGPTYCFDTLVN